MTYKFKVGDLVIFVPDYSGMEPRVYRGQVYSLPVDSDRQKMYTLIRVQTLDEKAFPDRLKSLAYAKETELIFDVAEIIKKKLAREGIIT